MAEVGVIYDQSLGNRGSNFRIRHQANGLHLNWYDVAVNTTRYAGQSSSGLLTFQPPDPTACTTTTGVTSATISGVIGLDG